MPKDGIERVETGIKGFDELVEGGLPQGSLTLVSGAPGTGKSIFCMQILYNNALKKRDCLYITFEQSEDDVRKQMQRFSWKWEKLDGSLKILSMELDDPAVLDRIQTEIKMGKYALVVVDSLASLAGAPIPPERISTYSLEKIASSIVPIPQEEESLTRQKVKMIINQLRKARVTALLTSEMSKNAEWMSRDTISEFLCDGIITIDYVEIGVADYRTMVIRKIRNSDHYKDVIPFNITSKGIEILVDELRKKK